MDFSTKLTQEGVEQLATLLSDLVVTYVEEEENVTIGEDNNTVRLTHAQWNDLVSRIQKGELTRVK